MKKVAIIVLHYKNWPDTRGCLLSLKKIDRKGVVVETIVVDNSGTKLIEKPLKDTFPQVKYLTTSQNLGFAGGNNLGIKQALNLHRSDLGKKKVDYILLLNNDTVVQGDFLKILVKTLRRDEAAGIIGPTIKHQVKGKTFYDYGGVINWYLGKTYHLNKTTNRDKRVRERDFVTGCCMLVKSEVFEKIGLLNEDYFLYLEDVEFCVRAQRGGFKVLLNPRAQIFHKGSQSISEWGKIKYSWRNSLRFSWEWVKWPGKILALFYNLIFYPTLFLRWKIVNLKNNLRF